ncbi:dTDP-4-dehydrorhamnose 3,5-epimerase family protein [Allonocardiopsis opalescens]|uniref:dTDP-4-dehydrorhamnose 3,5-epimerase n=1 Tax=Allonocardiopsis opalescens TaxID=1144618 RepID=A0A2T0QCW9_9ACTN|nr:dTDP-4-dehydrorhamnose 3,5-epimerase [Allonocardiopsis opalescens]PRY01748.1 dTDP-4-dehydrorhamnose 3,5-epimerase [Allonocardiopsis opalescens]
MRIDPLKLDGSYLVTPKIHPDDRGSFLELFNGPAFEAAVGHPLVVRQANCTSTRRDAIRGIHAFALPPSQARYVACPRGAVSAVVVDTRTGSPTFGESVPVELDDQGRQALYVAEGLGLAYMPTSEDATVVYLCSSTYAPQREILVNPLDPDLELPWPRDREYVLSAKDRAAPTLREAEKAGLLPDYAACQEWYARLREPGAGRDDTHD